MATISLDIPNALVTRVVAAVAKQMNVDASGFNATQQAALVKSYYKQVTVDAVKAFEVPTVSAAAAATRNTDIDTNVTTQIT